MRKVKLNPNAQKWVDALRSGKYQQTQSVLHDSDGHCCLGVLCDVAINNGLKTLTWHGGYREGYSCNGYESVLPPEAMKWVGLKDDCGKYDGSNLADQNDGGLSFDEIADLIEINAEELGVAEKTA